jgi:hypothetical protein
MEMPTIFIWLPKADDEVGHVALKTDRYYVSIWPETGLTDGKHIAKYLHLVEMITGVNACLVYHKNIDRECESDCDPVEYDISVAVTNEDLDPVIEEFLNYNEWKPEQMTIERSEVLYKKGQEYNEIFKLTKLKTPDIIQSNGLEKVDLAQLLSFSLPKTEYSFSAELVSDKEDEPFYHKQQSCVSLTFNLIQTAWLRRHPDQPITFSNPPELISDTSLKNSKFFYKVPWFEQVVQENLLTRNKNIHISTNKYINPYLGTHYLLKEFVKSLFIVVVVSLFCYICPGLSYPLFFLACVSFFKVSIRLFNHFLISLSLTLLSYYFPVLAVTITILYLLYLFYASVSNLKQSGELPNAIELCLFLAQPYLHKKRTEKKE